MDPNPYESPQPAPQVARLEKVMMSPLRIPLAVVCGAIAALFVFTFVGWCVALNSDSQERRRAWLYVPLSVLGVIAFALLAAGLGSKSQKLAGWGLALFTVGALVQVVF